MFRRSLLLILLLGAIGSLPIQARPQSAQCFTVPGITECIDGRIAQFWNTQGSLPVFGYPLTAERPELNRDSNLTLQMQWFERNRMELHPENKAPYDVLLGRLGAEGLARQGRGFEGIPTSMTPAGRCKTFDVGGQPQAVCDPFLRYWQTHGLEFDQRRGTSEAESLALFGLPLTYPKLETNANGDTVVTQWFERGRFEDHGAQGVLLGLLGRETLGSQPASPPPPQPTAPPVPQPTAPPMPQPTAPPVATVPPPAPTASPACHPSYPDFCIPPPPPDLDCPDIGRKDFRVRQPDPHGFDRDKDGIGCES